MTRRTGLLAFPLVVLMAWAFGSTVSAAFGAGRAPVVTGAVVAVAVWVFRLAVAMIEQDRRPAGLARAELIGVAVLLLGVAGSGASRGRSFVVTVGVGLITWVVVATVFRDVDELAADIHRSDITRPVDRLRSKFRFLAVLVVGCAAWAVVGPQGMMDLRRPGLETWSLWPVVFVLCGLLGMGFAGRATAMGRWERDGAVIEADVATRWATTLVVVVAVAAGVGMGAERLLPPVTSQPAAVAGWITGIESALDGAVGTIEENAELPEQTGDDGGAIAELDPPAATVTPDWAGDILLLGVAAAALWFFYKLGSSVQPSEGPVRRTGAGVWVVVREILMVLVDLVRALWRALASLLHLFGRRSDRVVGSQPQAGTMGAGRRRWQSSDPVRRRIVEAWGRFAAGPPARRPVETAREYAARVEAEGGEVETLTDLYERARYSTHLLGEKDAVTAERLSTLRSDSEER